MLFKLNLSQACANALHRPHHSHHAHHRQAARDQIDEPRAVAVRPITGTAAAAAAAALARSTTAAIAVAPATSATRAGHRQRREAP